MWLEVLDVFFFFFLVAQLRLACSASLTCFAVVCFGGFMRFRVVELKKMHWSYAVIGCVILLCFDEKVTWVVFFNRRDC